MTVTSICEVNGAGVQVTAVAVSDASAVLDCLNVEGRNVIKRYLNNTSEKTDKPVAGNFAILELDPNDRIPPLRDMVGEPPHMMAAYREPRVIVACGDERIESTEVRYITVEKFTCAEFTDPASGNVLTYWLYTPGNLAEKETCPLITFIHDAGACSEDKRTGLLQGSGGIVWAEDKWQADHPCFVLVPQYPRAIVDDDWNTTWEVEATNALIDHIAASYPVDTGRLYLTGQSMGCMTSCRLMALHPHKWAGAYLVAGQWEPTQMTDVTDIPIWYLVSDKDEKAFPGMNAIAAAWEDQGVCITRGAFDVLDGPATVNEAAQKLAVSNGKVFCTTLTGDGIIPPGMPRFPGVHHISTWIHAYSIRPIQEWLFSHCR